MSHPPADAGPRPIIGDETAGGNDVAGGDLNPMRSLKNDDGQQVKVIGGENAEHPSDVKVFKAYGPRFLGLPK